MTPFETISGLVSQRLSGGCRLFKPYDKQKEFFALGAEHDVRCLSGGNRTGKTLAVGGGELAFHLTGEYPDWWEGKRFNKPVTAWVGSTDWSTNIEGVQMRLVGDVAKGEIGKAVFDEGTGQFIPTGIPADSIIDTTKQSNVPNALSSVIVKHVSGGRSRVRFYAYSKGRENLQAGKADIVWMDEEPPLDVATELMARTMDSRGITLMTFTPLKGVSAVVQRFIGNVTVNERFPAVLQSDLGAMVRIRAQDAPHITTDILAKMKREYPAHEHMARIEGIPALGEGAIFRMSDQELTVPPFHAIKERPGMPPLHFQVFDAIDFGFTHPTARVRMVMDPDSKHVYVCNTYKRSGQNPVQHAGNWQGLFPGHVPVGWPHDGRNKETDGESKAGRYRKLGVKLTNSPVELPTGGNSVEGGLQLMVDWMENGLFHVVAGNQLWFQEKNLFRREKTPSGDLKIHKEFDDLMDATRYCFMGLLCGWGREVRHAFTETFHADFRTGRVIEDDPDMYDIPLR